MEELKWIPFAAEYEKEREIEVLTGNVPVDEQEILVTNGKQVWSDTFCNDGEECYLDSGYELMSDVIAWMPLPEPYKPLE